MLSVNININFLEYLSLPKLRKENPYLESDLNSNYQTYLYDFLFEQQSLYIYYNSQFKSQELDGSLINLKPIDELKIKVKSNKKLFAGLLEGIGKIIKDIIERNLVDAIWSIRNYSLEVENSKPNQLSQITNNM